MRTKSKANGSTKVIYDSEEDMKKNLTDVLITDTQYEYEDLTEEQLEQVKFF